jgi:hypothetical protein
MKRFILFVITGLLAAGLILQAGQREKARGRGLDVEQRLSQMQKRLNLTSDQVNKIRPILQDQNRKMEDLRAKNQNGTSTDRSTVRNQIRQVREDSMKRIEAALTPDQVTKLHQQRRGNAQGRQRNNGDNTHSE